jgi:hypothetical protein
MVVGVGHRRVIGPLGRLVVFLVSVHEAGMVVLVLVIVSAMLELAQGTSGVVM